MGEGLINDGNRSIATLAITTLLKTGSESGVERLMKQITSFMSEIADEFKIVVVDAIRAMCIKFPQKHRLLMTFLSNVLREEGGFQYKKAQISRSGGVSVEVSSLGGRVVSCSQRSQPVFRRKAVHVCRVTRTVCSLG